MFFTKKIILCGALLTTTAFANHHTEQKLQIFEVKEINGKELIVDFGLTGSTNINSITVVSDKEFTEAKGGKIVDDCVEICGEKHCLKNGKYTSSTKVDGSTAIAFSRKVNIVKFKRMSTLSGNADDIKGIKSQEPTLESTGYSYEPIIDLRSKTVDLNLKMKEKSIATEKACQVNKTDEFSLIKCKENILLYANGSLQLVSSTDSYGKIEITIFSTFEIDGAKFYLIKYGTKGRTYKALLKKVAGKWEILKGIDDYPTTC